MRLILLSLFLFIGLSTLAQNITNNELEPKGVYREINLSNDIKIIQQLLDTSSSNPALIASVEKDANNYTPPVLYVLSNILFTQKKFNEACFWFYVAQLRARYDVNRCTDRTANANAYNQNFGPNINEYAFKHRDSLKVIVQNVVDFVRLNDESYDQRWINLTGMDAMKASLSDKPADKKLSIDKSKWPAIKKKTLDDYYEDFKEATNRDVTVDKNTLLEGDYRLFQNTPAWTLTKAAADGDTSGIRNEILKNKSLLSFREARFGQSLLKLTVMNKDYKSVQTLLELGADPNMQDLYSGDSALMEAANIGTMGIEADPRFLRLLLKYGGNPNLEEKGPHSRGETSLTFALGNGNLEYVKILVDAGANVNFVNEYNRILLGDACIAAQLTGNPDFVSYLIEKGADYKRPFLTTVSGDKYYITNAMRDWRFDLGSEAYKKKMQLVDFLKKNGMDYRTTKIPEQYLNDYPKEYLEKY